ncbi:hypothetical protein [Hafnia paralvei]|uniref:hypothetical protein n=1 Tax=Hafnia paralvei TaxID=546367 RepID=UPI0018F0C25C|nr:hypothetical protein [Hafnia paralvei]MBW2958395.1 hypothetical protein [Hafnia paralvei]MCQ4170102.1 hypothetical protein [Hafnia paralvei]
MSDFDIALAGDDILNAAKEAGISTRSGGLRTGPLKARDMAKLGVKGLSDRMSEQYGREVNFMIFSSIPIATGRAPSIVLP